MATRITIPFQAPTGEGSAVYHVDEDFDAVMEKCAPSRPPSSAMENRLNQTYTVGGKRLWIGASPIAAEENHEED